MSQTFNNWTNYSTWARHQYIYDCDEAMGQWMARAQELDVTALAAELEEESYAGLAEMPTSFYREVLVTAIKEVNHLEIAEWLKGKV